MFEIDVNLLLSLFWFAISIGVLVPGLWLLFDGQTNISIVNIVLQRFYLFGKLKNATKDKRNVLGDVSKSYFLHFYLVGLLINVPLFLFYRSSFAVYILFICHMLRRLYECFYIHRYGSNSTMSFIHYLIGIVHYPTVGLTIIVDHYYGHKHISFGSTCLALFIFLNASFVQYRVHSTLANAHRTKTETYPIPNGFWLFEYFSCPNYIAEIFIYISFYLLSYHTLCFISLTIWVIVNQCLSALLAHRWYRQHYGALYPAKRCALIPLIF
ncbi:unnamed protein product [Adineta ricciae]|uniref:Polyprenal reductase n=1 Tax=Adineta ricciae TaxID=249248 RepID=A0A814ANM6_ADIRI|nr:unnamed protein product [Adineta ricciae]CAF0916795.1 unnamed protein product [Adineta ricciae]